MPVLLDQDQVVPALHPRRDDRLTVVRDVDAAADARRVVADRRVPRLREEKPTVLGGVPVQPDVDADRRPKDGLWSLSTTGGLVGAEPIPAAGFGVGMGVGVVTGVGVLGQVGIIPRWF